MNKKEWDGGTMEHLMHVKKKNRKNGMLAGGTSNAGCPHVSV